MVNFPCNDNLLRDSLGAGVQNFAQKKVLVNGLLAYKDILRHLYRSSALVGVSRRVE